VAGETVAGETVFLVTTPYNRQHISTWLRKTSHSIVLKESNLIIPSCGPLGNDVCNNINALVIHSNVRHTYPLYASITCTCINMTTLCR